MCGTRNLSLILTIAAILGFSFFTLDNARSTLALPEQISIRGSQQRGVPGRNAVLESAPVKLPRAGVIDSVEGGRAGFWITGSRRLSFDSANQAIGTRLPAGTYQVYPNLPRGADTASVTLNVTLQP